MNYSLVLGAPRGAMAVVKTARGIGSVSLAPAGRLRTRLVVVTAPTAMTAAMTRLKDRVMVSMSSGLVRFECLCL